MAALAKWAQKMAVWPMATKTPPTDALVRARARYAARHAPQVETEPRRYQRGTVRVVLRMTPAWAAALRELAVRDGCTPGEIVAVALAQAGVNVASV